MIQLLFPLVQVFLPLCLYRKTGRRMTRFYMMMLGLENARRFYVRLLVIFLLLFHFVYVGANPGEYGVLLSTVLSVLLYRFKRADRWLHRLHEGRKAFAAWALLAVAASFIPHLYTTAITVGFIFWRPSFILPLQRWTDGRTRGHVSIGGNTLRCCPNVITEPVEGC